MNRLSGFWNPHELLYSEQKLILTLITESHPACDSVCEAGGADALQTNISSLAACCHERLDLVTQVIFAASIFLNKEH